MTIENFQKAIDKRADIHGAPLTVKARNSNSIWQVTIIDENSNNKFSKAIGKGKSFEEAISNAIRAWDNQADKR